MRHSKIVLALAAAASLVSFGSAASAMPYAAHRDHQRHHHPRQHEVLAREHHQLHRINRERREGEISGRQAQALRAHDRGIAREMHADARANGGHITPGEQHALNQQLNAQSRVIGH